MIKEIFGIKLGMTQVYNENADLVGVTVVGIEPVCVLEKVTYAKKVKAKIGCFKVTDNKLKKVKKPIAGYFKKLDVSAYKLIKEVDIEDEKSLELKKEIGVDMFSEGMIVDVRSKSKGKGFQGGMKRWGWGGQPRTHGSTTHRRIGSAGATTFPGRIIRGLHMPGHTGNRYNTIKNLRVVKIDKEKQVVFIEGAIPGASNAVVSIKKVK